jgi:hypothetical protein
MSFAYKILGQQYVGLTETPDGNGGYGYYYGGIGGETTEELVPVTLYTVPAGKQTVVSSIFVTNHDSVERTFDVAVVPFGETLAVKHHLRWDYPVGAADFEVISAKLTLAAGDSIVVLPSTADKVGFTAFGVEETV